MTEGSKDQNERWSDREAALASASMTSDVLTMEGLVLDGPQESVGLHPIEVARPIPAEGEALVEIRAAAVNRSDLLNVQGLPVTTFPRILGRDFSGTVIEGPAGLVGREVWGSGAGDLGFTRDGSHAHFAALPVAGLVEKPRCLTHAEAAACGLAYYTAAVASLVLGRVQAGQSVLILGAAGGIGSAATCIATWKGATVIGAVKDARESAAVRSRGLGAVVDTSGEDLAACVRDLTSGCGVDLVIDTVGPVLFDAALASLGMDGRIVVMTAPVSAPVTVDLGTLYRKRQSILGLSTIKGDIVRAAELLTTLLPGFESRALLAPPIAKHVPLAQAADAYALVAQGAPGRVILINESAAASP
jgi:NADPH2:quinone reductase